MNVSYKRGFTILELLVVIAIIAIITAIALAFLSNAREKSRDSRRLSELRQIETALNLYFTSTNAFPIETVTLDGTDAVSVALRDGDHIPTVPLDPLHPAQTYDYSSTDGSGYTLSFCLETDSIEGFSEGCGNTITQ